MGTVLHSKYGCKYSRSNSSSEPLTAAMATRTSCATTPDYSTALAGSLETSTCNKEDFKDSVR